MIEIPLNPPQQAKYTFRVLERIAKEYGLDLRRRGLVKDDAEVELIDQPNAEGFSELVSEINIARPLLCIAQALHHADSDAPDSAKITATVDDLKAVLGPNEPRLIHQQLLANDPNWSEESDHLRKLTNQLPFEAAQRALLNAIAEQEAKAEWEAKAETAKKKQSTAAKKKKAR